MRKAEEPLMQMDEAREKRNDLEERTLTFSCEAVDFVATVPRAIPGDVIGRQFLKSSTSIGANYREANRSESKQDFIHKIGIVEKEASETEYWLQICCRKGIGEPESASRLLAEAKELLAIFTTISRRSKGR